MQDDFQTTFSSYGESIQGGDPGNYNAPVHSSFDSQPLHPDALARQRMLAKVVGEERPVGYAWVSEPTTSP